LQSRPVYEVFVRPALNEALRVETHGLSLFQEHNLVDEKYKLEFLGELRKKTKFNEVDKTQLSPTLFLGGLL